MGQKLSPNGKASKGDRAPALESVKAARKPTSRDKKGADITAVAGRPNRRISNVIAFGLEGKESAWHTNVRSKVERDFSRSLVRPQTAGHISPMKPWKRTISALPRRAAGTNRISSVDERSLQMVRQSRVSRNGHAVSFAKGPWSEMVIFLSPKDDYARGVQADHGSGADR